MSLGGKNAANVAENPIWQAVVIDILALILKIEPQREVT